MTSQEDILKAIDLRNCSKIVSYTNKSGNQMKPQVIAQKDSQNNHFKIKKILSQEFGDSQKNKEILLLKECNVQEKQETENYDEEYVIQSTDYFIKRVPPSRSSDVLTSILKVEDQNQARQKHQQVISKANEQQQQNVSLNIQNYHFNATPNCGNNNKKRHSSISNLFENEIINSRITESRTKTFSQSNKKLGVPNFQECDFGVMSVDVPQKRLYKDLHKMERQINFNNKILLDKSNSFHVKRSNDTKSQIANITCDSIHQPKQANLDASIQKYCVSHNVSQHSSPQSNKHRPDILNQFCNLDQAIFNPPEVQQSEKVQQSSHQAVLLKKSPQIQKEISYILQKSQSNAQQEQNKLTNLLSKMESDQQAILQKMDNSNKNKVPFVQDQSTNTEQIAFSSPFIQPQVLQNSSIKKISNGYIQQQQNQPQLCTFKAQQTGGSQLKQIQNYQQQQQALQLYHQQHNQNSLSKNSSFNKQSESNQNLFMKQYEEMIAQFNYKKEDKIEVQIVEEKQTYDIRIQVQKEVSKSKQPKQTKEQAQLKSPFIEKANHIPVLNSQKLLPIQHSTAQQQSRQSQEKGTSLDSYAQKQSQRSSVGENKVATLDSYQIIPRNNIQKNSSLQKKEEDQIEIQTENLQKKNQNTPTSAKNLQNTQNQKNIKTVITVQKGNSSKIEKTFHHQSQEEISLFFRSQAQIVVEKDNCGNGLQSQNQSMDENITTLFQKQMSKKEQQSEKNDWFYKNYVNSSSITLKPINPNPKKDNLASITSSKKNNTATLNPNKLIQKGCQTNLENLEFEQNDEQQLANQFVTNQPFTERSLNLKSHSTRQINDNASKPLCSQDLNFLQNNHFMSGSNFTILDLKNKKEGKAQLNDDSNLLNHLENRFNRKQSFLQSNLKLITQQTTANAHPPINGFYQLKINNKSNPSQGKSTVQQKSLNQPAFFKPMAAVAQTVIPAASVVGIQSNIISPKNNKTLISNGTYEDSSLTQLHQNARSFQIIEQQKPIFKQNNKFQQIFKNSPTPPLLPPPTAVVAVEQLLKKKSVEGTFEIKQQPLNKFQRKEIQLSMLSKSVQQNS